VKKSVCIIGAGFAGLSAATFMARAGWKVTILEKNGTAGGRARQLISHGFTFDMGPSWYWMPEIFEKFFASFGKKISDYYSLKRLDPSYRVYWKNGLTNVPANYEEFKQMFEEIEPGSGTKLDAYLEEARIKYEIGVGKLVISQDNH
jgi:phytoene desaturase